jgi:tRNA U34 5-carboxymethylaminomethyl modifying enzyme MnmG/GidA
VVKYISVNPPIIVRGLTEGLQSYPAGRAGEPPSLKLSQSLKAGGFQLGRLKTGTPARLAKCSVDFTKLQTHEGDQPPLPFSFMNERPQIQVHFLSIFR